MPKINTFLWFNDNAEEAMNFYVSIFPNSKVVDVARQGDGGPAFLVTFELDGQEFMGLNGGPRVAFTEAISLFVSCADQAEVDHLWDRLISGGGEPSQCGWLKDKFGLSWQIIPKALGEMMGDSDREKAGRAMEAMLTMQKIDIGVMRQAFDGR